MPGMASTGSRGMLRVHRTGGDGVAALRGVNVTIEPPGDAVPGVRDGRRMERSTRARRTP